MDVSDLKQLNEATINALTIMKRATKRNEIIDKILQDEACFFKMKKEDAIGILEDIGVQKNKTEILYQSLISEDSYKKVKNNIAKEDLALNVEEMYSVDVFKNRKKENTEINTAITVNKKGNIFQRIIKKLLSKFTKN